MTDTPHAHDRSSIGGRESGRDHGPASRRPAAAGHRPPDEGTVEERRRRGEASPDAWDEPRRDGDHGLGIPRSNAGDGRVLTRAEVEEHDRREEKEEEEEIRGELARKLRPDDAGRFRLPAPILSFLSWTLLAAASILGLLLVGQGAAAVGHIRALPTPFNWIAGVGATGCSVVLAALIARLGWALMRLRRSPAVNLAGLRALSERRQWQRLALHHVDRARLELRRHLQEYESRAAHRQLNDDERTRLEDARRELLVEPQTLSPSEWLEAFTGRFQSVLDAVAARRVRAYAVKVGVGTAASRFPLLDQAIVLYACMALLRELLALYGLRPTAFQAALLLARSVMTTYLSGLLQDVSDNAADAATTAADNLPEDGPLQDMISEVGLGTGEAVGTGLLAPLAGRAAEGAINGVLVWRLGTRAVAQIQPVRPAK